LLHEILLWFSGRLLNGDEFKLAALTEMDCAGGCGWLAEGLWFTL